MPARSRKQEEMCVPGKNNKTKRRQPVSHSQHDKTANLKSNTKDLAEREDREISQAVERAIRYQRNVVENKAGIALAIQQSEGRELEIMDRP